MKRKVFSLILAVALLISLFTVVSFAAEKKTDLPLTEISQDIVEEDKIDEAFTSVFKALGGVFLYNLLFVPGAIALVAFIYLNSSYKKKIKDYENLITQNKDNYIYTQNNYRTIKNFENMEAPNKEGTEYPYNERVENPDIEGKSYYSQGDGNENPQYNDFGGEEK